MATRPNLAPPYVAEEALYLDADGKVIKGGDSPRIPQGAVTLLAPEGGTIPADRARSLGLVPGDPAEAVPLRSEPAAGITPAPTGQLSAEVTAEETQAEQPRAEDREAPPAAAAPRRARAESDEAQSKRK